ncbi:MAG TPA: ABC transporter substrate-binding protein [Burkholderiaceae bacterium]|nr:ABC transporter substrate-binding protein [Burkholderiaceae bacterium]
MTRTRSGKLRVSGAACALLIACAALLPPASRAEAEPVVFATNWKAQAAHGGFYQALVDGTYARFGLNVTIRQGGPQVNNRPLLPAGRIDFLMTGNLLHAFDNLKNGVPTVQVAAIFQKDPQALIAHPGQGYERFERLKDAPVVLVAKDAQFTWWQWLKVVHGFRDEQLRPYNFNLGPFLANPRSLQQGYSIAEPIYVQREGHFEPVVHLLADHGFDTYSTLIEARLETVRSHPDLVQRFVDASILGWIGYLYGDRRSAHAAMLRDNPEIREDELEASLALMRSQGIVDSGDALTQGIGTMNAARIRHFYQSMVAAGLYAAGEIDPTQVATLQFVNKGAGLELKRRLTRNETKGR